MALLATEKRALDDADRGRWEAASVYAKPGDPSEREILASRLCFELCDVLNETPVHRPWFRFTPGGSYCPAPTFAELMIDNLAASRSPRREEPSACSTGTLSASLDHVRELATALNAIVGREPFKVEDHSEGPVLVAIAPPTSHTQFVNSMRVARAAIAGVIETFRVAAGLAE